MSFQNALTQLAALSVSGIVRHYGIDSVPETLGRAQLPALLVLPIDTQDTRLFRELGEGFQAVAFAAGTRTVTYTLTHLLLVASVDSGSVREHLPVLVACIDAYFDALGGDVLLAGTLLEPPQVKVEPGIFTLGGVRYYGCAFRHKWLIDV